MYDKNWYRENSERVRNYQKKWRKNNPEKVRQFKKSWQEKNPYYDRERYKKNPEKVIMRAKRYYQSNREKVKEHSYKWRRSNPERVLAIKQRYNRNIKLNPKYRLDRSVHTSIYYVLKGKKAGRRWEDLVGYRLEELVKHLESKFESWMSWENYGKWVIDHITPKSYFKYQTAEDPEFKKCWALENLQPMEKIANIKKGNKLKVV